ncbi:putative ABC transporter permease [Apilactobacillus kunkeei]|nr:putative ABC transporter permease [Apilactobacillus kunkeei]CAI2700560.1 putative ABC transporter permease [Apilactobacillus kunkeei]
MFLSLREIKKSKFRYSLICLVIVMIAYLIFILTALANGLSEANRQAIDSWNAEKIVLNSDANGSLDQSTITAQQAKKASADKRADITQMSANVQTLSEGNKVGSQVIGLNKRQFIYRDLKIVKGHNFTKDNEVVVDQSLLETDGYHLGEKVKFSRNGHVFKIVGTVKNDQLNVAPVIYATNNAVQTEKFGTDMNHTISAMIYRSDVKKAVDGTQIMDIEDFIQDIPGYSAQNSTFEFMIAFLLLITLVVISIFLYVLTMQKIPYFAVLKVQGVSNGYLAMNVISNALILSIVGVVISGLLTFLTAISMPAAVPMTFDITLMGSVAVMVIVMSIIGGLIPMRTVAKIDPAKAMGGS